jgi:hypothetical protein
MYLEMEPEEPLHVVDTATETEEDLQVLKNLRKLYLELWEVWRGPIDLDMLMQDVLNATGHHGLHAFHFVVNGIGAGDE